MIWKYKLSDILQIVSKSFKELFYDFDFWFESEVSRISVIWNNAYLELVEFDNNQKINAKAKGIIFDVWLYYKFLEKINIKNIEDIKWYKLLMNWRVQFHNEYWFSIYISEISADYTLWQLQSKQTDILTELKKLWIVNKNKETFLWFPPYNIAVISSKSSQWLKDFQTILDQSAFNFSYSYYYCSIHWNEAIKEVYEELQKIYSDINKWKKIDLVAIIRWWWGSSWILWQNDLSISKWICYMPVPVMVAIWHTNDKFVLDEICKFSAKTPTDASYIIIEKMENWLYDIDKYRQNIGFIIKNKFEFIKNDIENLVNSIKISSKNLYNKIKSDFENFYQSIMSYDPEKLKNYWYWILIDFKWEYLNKYNIEKLKEEDELTLKIYDKKINIKVTKIL